MSEATNKTADILKSVLLQYHNQIQQNISKISETVDNNFTNLDKRLTSIEEKLSALSKDTSIGFSEVDRQLVSIKGELEKIDQVTFYEETLSNLKKVVGGKK